MSDRVEFGFRFQVAVSLDPRREISLGLTLPLKNLQSTREGLYCLCTFESCSLRIPTVDPLRLISEAQQLRGSHRDKSDSYCTAHRAQCKGGATTAGFGCLQTPVAAQASGALALGQYGMLSPDQDSLLGVASCTVHKYWPLCNPQPEISRV